MESKIKKPSDRGQIVVKTLRISVELEQQINELALKTGASFNSTMCLLLQLGLKHFE